VRSRPELIFKQSAWIKGARLLHDNNCTFANDLKIDDPRILTALLLLYDKVYLPHPYDIDPSCARLYNLRFDDLGYLDIERKWYLSWKDEQRALFAAGALEVLQSPKSIAEMPADLDQKVLQQLGPGAGVRSPGATHLGISKYDVLEGKVSLAMHVLFANAPAPDLILARNALSVDEIRLGLVQSAVARRMPILKALVPDQILEIRETTRDYREGFYAYLAELADNVEKRVSQGRTLKSATDEEFGRTVEPALLEHIRQELPRRVSWWSSLVRAIGETAGQTLSVVTQPWRVKNYSDLIEKLADKAEFFAKEATAERSNKQRALQFIGKLNKQ
jgi:hypothetical protein